MAQLDNAADSDSEDRGFESLRAGQEISRLTGAGDFFLKRRDSKDERDRATVRWTVATASDQAPAGARIAIPSSGPRNFSPHRGGGFLFKTKGFEGRAGQSNSPVDSCDRERPSARRRANRNPFERAKKFLVSSRRGISFLRRDSKDERHRATVRWTVATASDQAPAGARIESLRAGQESRSL